MQAARTGTVWKFGNLPSCSSNGVESNNEADASALVQRRGDWTLESDSQDALQIVIVTQTG